MISDPDAARRVSALMLEIGAKLDASIADVQVVMSSSRVREA